MTGVQADAQPLAAAGRLDQPSQLLEGASQRAARARRVLQVQLAALAVGQGRRDRLAGPPDGLPDVTLQGRAGVQDDACRPDALPDPQRVGQRDQRFGAYVPVLAGAVEQVDGVDDDGVDGAGGHRLAEGRHVLVAVDGGLPHAGGLVEDLDRAAAPLHASFDRLGQATGRGDVRADQHGAGVGRATVSMGGRL